MKRLIRVVAVLLISLAVISCASPVEDSEPRLPTVHVAAPDSIGLGASAFPIEIVLTNPHGLPYKLYEQVIDPVVVDANGETVWRPWRGWTGPAVVAAVLRPGESHVVVETWDLRDDEGQPVRAGEYLLHVNVHVTGPPITVQRRLTITP
jgi:hypothetical protein